MAYDKIVDSAVLDANLTIIANAIRAKGGSSASLEFPYGMAAAINAIESGSGGNTAKPKIIRMTVNHTTLDSVAWGGKTYREIFLNGNMFSEVSAITEANNSGWAQYSNLAKPTPTTEDYNTGPIAWNCSGSASVQMSKDLSLPNDSTFYIACKRRLASYTAGGWLGVEVYYVGGAGKVISDTVDASSVSETFETVSHTFTPKTATTQVWIGSGGSAKLTGYVDDVVCINMTELFGENTPSKSDMNTLYEEFLLMYKADAEGKKFTAYGAFADESGQRTSCSVPVEAGNTYYVPVDGTSAMVVFKNDRRTTNGSELLIASSQSEDIDGHTLCSNGEITVYCMHPNGDNDVCNVTIDLGFVMRCLASNLIAIAEAEVGYLEKASNAQLDSKTANAGSANFTKYARDLDAISGFYNTPKNGAAWCDIWVDWCFVRAFGVEAAKKLLCQPDNSLGAGVDWSANYYRWSGRFYTSDPKVGDQIFFKNTDGVEVHTGLVYKVDSTKVYTIEGNTSNGVFKLEYSLSDTSIVGYGRPNYDPE